jgi:uncharacterized protein
MALGPADQAPRWRRYRVARRVIESENAVSLHLEPADGFALPAFHPGQFLTFKIPGPEGRPVPRSYSISSDPDDTSHYRISVKREPMGIGSGHIHDAMPQDAIIEASPPKGEFVLDEASTRPVVLLAGGIGVTPLLSMAYRLARQGTRRTTLIHACENGAQQSFRDEIVALTARAPNVRVITCLANPSAADLAAAHHQHKGFVTRAVLEPLMPLAEAEAYMCGPGPFMQAMFDLLLSLGMPEERIAYEFFGPVAKLTPTPVRTPA